MDVKDSDVQLLKSEVAAMRKDFQKYMEKSNEQNIDRLVREMRLIFSRPLVEYMSQEARERLEQRLDPKCENRAACLEALGKLLSETAELADKDHVDKDLVDSYWDRINGLIDSNPERCGSCLREASQCYGKQIEVLRTLRIYSGEDEKAPPLSELPIEQMSSEVCEPLAHKKRFMMLQSLASESKSFSELSQLTGLRAGNLLYHMQKLLDSGLILQISERGDYTITAKGYTVLKSFADMYVSISSC